MRLASRTGHVSGTRRGKPRIALTKRRLRVPLEVLEARTLLTPPTITALITGIAAAPAAFTNVDATPVSGSQAEVGVAINPTNPANMIIAPVDLSSGAPQTHTVWVSQDAGATWSAVSIPLPPNAVSGADPSVVFNNQGNAVFAHLAAPSSSPSGPFFVSTAVSTDGGKTWLAAAVDGPTGVADDRPFLAVGPSGYVLTWTKSGSVQASSSSDGLIWSPSVTVGTGKKNVDAHAAVSPSGAVYLVWENDATSGKGLLEFSLSTDTGKTWSTQKAIYTSNINTLAGYFIPAQPDRGISMGLSDAVDMSQGTFRGRFYVAFDDAPTSHDDTNIYVMYSDDGGKTFGGPVEVNDDGGTNSQFFPALAVDPTTGAVGVSWYDARNDIGQGGGLDPDLVPNSDVQVFGAISITGGSTFSKNFLLSSPTFASNAHDAGPFNLGDYTGSAFFGASYYAAWADNTDSGIPANPDGSLGPTDIYTSRAVTSEIVTANEPGATKLYVRMAPTGPSGILSEYVEFYESSTIMGIPTFTSTLPSVSSLDQFLVNNTDGQSLQLTVDFSFGNPVPSTPPGATPATGLVLTGNSAGTTSLVLQGTPPATPTSTPFATETYAAAGPGSGSILLTDSFVSGSFIGNNTLIVFSGLQPITDIVPLVTTLAILPANFTFQPPAGAGVVNLTALAAPGQMELNSGDIPLSFERIDFKNKPAVTVDAATPGAAAAQLVVNFSNGNPIPAGGVAYAGVPGGFNILKLQGARPSGPFLMETYTATALGAGVINLDGSILAFVNLAPIEPPITPPFPPSIPAPITDIVAATNYVFFGPDGPNVTTLVGAAAVTGQTDIESPTASFEAVDIANKSSLTLNGGNGDEPDLPPIEEPDPVGSGNSFVVLNTPSGINTTINTSSAALVPSLVQVEATTGPLYINDPNDPGPLTDPDTIMLGFLDHSVQRIMGAVTLGPDGSDKDDLLIVDDGSDPVAKNGMTLSTNPSSVPNPGMSTLTGLAPASISYTADDLVPSATVNGVLFSGLTILGGPGGNTLTIDFSGGNPIPDLFFNGGPPLDTDSNSLVLMGSLPPPNGPFVDEVTTLTAPGSGNVVLTDSAGNHSVINFANLRPITDTVPVPAYKLSVPSLEADTNIKVGPTVGGVVTTDVSSADNPKAFETVDFGNKTQARYAFGGAADPTVNVVALPPEVSLTIIGGPGDDTINVTALGLGAGDVLSLDGGGGSNTLNVDAGGQHLLAVPDGTVMISGVPVFDYIDFDFVNVFNVAEEALTPAGVNITPTEGTTFTGAVATFADAAVLPAASFFSGTINWGDGTMSSFTGANPAEVTVLPGNVIRVSASHTYYRYGNYATSVTVNDSGGTNSTISAGAVVSITEFGGAFAIAEASATVADQALTQVTAETITPIEAQSFTGAVASFTDANSLSTAADFSATIRWGDGAITAGTIGRSAFGGFFDVIGTHTYAEDTTATGPLPVATDIFDLAGNNPALGSSLTITGAANVADAPLLSTGAPSIPGVANVPLSVTNFFPPAVAVLSDGNPNPDAGDFPEMTSAQISWGDGTPLVFGTVVPLAGNTFVVRGDHTYTKPGNYQIEVIMFDTGGSRTEALSEAVITRQYPPPLPSFLGALAVLPGIEGVAGFGGGALVAVVPFVDVDINAQVGDFSVQINYGDGTILPGKIEQSGSDKSGGVDFLVLAPTHIYSEEGTYTMTVTLTENGVGTISETQPITVLDAQLTAEHAAFNAPEDVATTGVVATFTDPNLAAPVTGFTASITWGDGSPADTGNITQLAPGVFAVSGTHTYTDSDPNIDPEGFPVGVTITDIGGSVAFASSQANVFDQVLVDPPTNFKAVAGTVFQGNVASFSTAPLATAGEFTAVINWGDGQSSQAAIMPAGSGKFVVVGGHTYAKPGMYSVVTVVHGDEGQSVSDTSIATVSLSSIAARGRKVTALPRRTFSGTVASLTSASHAKGSSFSALIDWGDGSVSTGVVVARRKSAGGAGSAFAVLGRHAYAAPGNYAGQVSIFQNGSIQAIVQLSTTVGHESSGTGKLAKAPASQSSIPLSVGQAVRSSHPMGPLGAFPSRRHAHRPSQS
jgi:PKD repeat protein